MSVSQKQIAFAMVGLAAGLGALSPTSGCLLAIIFLTTAVFWWVVE